LTFTWTIKDSVRGARFTVILVIKVSGTRHSWCWGSITGIENITNDFLRLRIAWVKNITENFLFFCRFPFNTIAENIISDTDWLRTLIHDFEL
jgi:hypothetical protein